MATTYVVLLERLIDDDDEPADQIEAYIPWGEPVEAANAEQACRQLAERMEDLGDGVTMRAVPARNWESGRNTFKAETRRRLLKS